MFNDEFYTNTEYVNKTLSLSEVKTERYDILAKDMLKYFNIRITSKYFAFLIYLDNGKITKSYGANSGSNLVDFKKTSAQKNYSDEAFYQIIKDNKIPAYIRC